MPPIRVRLRIKLTDKKTSSRTGCACGTECDPAKRRALGEGLGGASCDRDEARRRCAGRVRATASSNRGIRARLNEHYPASAGASPLHPGVELLRAPRWRGGEGTAFVIEMNRTFEDFVVVALREALNVRRTSSLRACGTASGSIRISRLKKLQPDLSWWDGERCAFVGDVRLQANRPRRRAGGSIPAPCLPRRNGPGSRNAGLCSR